MDDDARVEALAAAYAQGRKDFRRGDLYGMGYVILVGKLLSSSDNEVEEHYQMGLDDEGRSC